MKVSEADLSKLVEDMLERCHWRWCHFRPARTDKGWRTAVSGHKGFPDYVAVSDSEYRKDRRLLFIELKSEGGEPSPEQEGWLNDLRECRHMITMTPLVAKPKSARLECDILALKESYEVYLWRPSDTDEIMEVLK